MKTIGIVPARMAASRFPGKPLHPICGRPMLEHCYLRAKMFAGWDVLAVATCDEEIRDFCEDKGFPAIMTADTHTRALDRVAEATTKCGTDVADDDIVVCVQGDEPLLGPDVIEAVRLGAVNYLLKPATPASVGSAVERALLTRSRTVVADATVPELVGDSKAMVEVRHRVLMAARSDVHVLVTVISPPLPRRFSPALRMARASSRSRG